MGKLLLHLSHDITYLTVEFTSSLYWLGTGVPVEKILARWVPIRTNIGLEGDEEKLCDEYDGIWRLGKQGGRFLGGEQRSLSLVEFRWDEHRLLEFCPMIGDDEFTTRSMVARMIRDPRVRLAHSCIATTISGRRDSTQRITLIDLFFIYYRAIGERLRKELVLEHKRRSSRKSTKSEEYDVSF
ncbi:hypothetical protein Tco_1030804 [Tanacetum coccineum]|uniref:Uncharacterized protein n=1 Tax=Tanacetum coccineum TaxID=301880 RepID=A0ABQ5G791_9ASTR